MRREEHNATSHAQRTALVTGGAGFIGSHLCDRLIQQGYRVICLDDFSSGDPTNVRPLLNHPRFEMIEQDVAEPLHIRGSIDRIYNLACPASPPHYQRDPVRTLRTSVLGAQHVLELAQQKGARVLQASTSEVYGDPDVHPQPETYLGNVNPIGPRACYDEGKRCAETLFFDYQRTRRTRIKVVRIFNTYGARMLENDGRVVSNFIVQALRGDPITIYGDGSQTRSFCYVDDLVDGLQRLMESADDVTGPINLGNPNEVTIGTIAEMVLQMTGSKSKLVRRPLPQDDPRRRRPVIERAEKLLNWKPLVPLERGLQATIDYFSMKLSAPEIPSPAVPIRIASTNLRPRAAAPVS
jgi:UDP-glucuronate decarboxylase